MQTLLDAGDSRKSSGGRSRSVPSPKFIVSTADGYRRRYTSGIPLEAQLENEAAETYHGYPMPVGDPLGREILRLWKSP